MCAFAQKDFADIYHFSTANSSLKTEASVSLTGRNIRSGYTGISEKIRLNFTNSPRSVRARSEMIKYDNGKWASSRYCNSVYQCRRTRKINRASLCRWLATRRYFLRTSGFRTFIMMQLIPPSVDYDRVIEPRARSCSRAIDRAGIISCVQITWVDFITVNEQQALISRSVGKSLRAIRWEASPFHKIIQNDKSSIKKGKSRPRYLFVL